MPHEGPAVKARLKVSNRAIHWARSVRGISTRAKTVLLLLADHADKDGVAYPGQNTLAEDGCLSVRSVIRAIHELRAKGLVDVFNRVSCQGNHANGYALKSANLTDSNDVQKCQPDVQKCQPDTLKSANLTPEPSENPHEPFSLPPGEPPILVDKIELALPVLTKAGFPRGDVTALQPAEREHLQSIAHLITPALVDAALGKVEAWRDSQDRWRDSQITGRDVAKNLIDIAEWKPVSQPKRVPHQDQGRTGLAPEKITLKKL